MKKLVSLLFLPFCRFGKYIFDHQRNKNDKNGSLESFLCKNCFQIVELDRQMLVSITVNKEIYGNLIEVTCWRKGEGHLSKPSSRGKRLVFETLDKEITINL